MPEGFDGMDRLIKRLGELAFDTRHVERPLKAAGTYAIGSIQRNFDEQGRPDKWSPLSPRTLASRRKGKGGGGPKILIDRARLRNSINEKVHLASPDSYAEVGTNVVYAARQHFGYPGGSGRGHSKTPARKFLMLQQEDFPRIERIFTRHIEKR
jgi:phage virion morphogenesis protein